MFFEISVNTTGKTSYRDITGNIESIVYNSNILNGMCLVFVPHTSAGVLVSEGHDERVMEDLLNYLNLLVPRNPKNLTFKHIEGNSDAHIKAALIGNSVCIPVADGKLILGKWQRIIFLEFDGPRTRRVIVKIVGR